MAWTEWMGIVSAVVAAIFGFMKFRQSQRVDATSAQSGVVSNQREGTEQVIRGLNLLVDQYQETVKESREVISLLEGRIVAVTAEGEACRKEVARLRKLYEPSNGK